MGSASSPYRDTIRSTLTTGGIVRDAGITEAEFRKLL